MPLMNYLPMTMIRTHGGIIILISLMTAMALRILPLPEALTIYNPDWVALIVIYWCLALPERFGVGGAWFTGLFTDVLTGRLLGQYALSYCVVAFVCIKLHQQLRVFPPSQQALIVLILLSLCQLLIFWTQGIQGKSLDAWSYAASSITGAMAWPLVFMILREVRQRHRMR